MRTGRSTNRNTSRSLKQEIKTGKTNYCETVFISKLSLKKKVAWPGDSVCFSCHLKMEARQPSAAKEHNLQSYGMGIHGKTL